MYIIIKSSCWEEQDATQLFGDEKVLFTDAVDLPSLLVELKLYPSKGQAIKAGRQGVIAKGYSEVRATKIHNLYIWNPDKHTADYTQEAKEMDKLCRKSIYQKIVGFLIMLKRLIRDCLMLRNRRNKET